MSFNTQTFKLNTGAEMPAIGLGTWKAAPGEVYEAVRAALASGYRHIDAAFAYGNEKEVGAAIKDSNIPREEIFVTSKLWSTHHADVEKGLQLSLDNLGMDYLDLYLLHWPVALNPNGNHPRSPTLPDGSKDVDPKPFIDTYAEMIPLLKTGKVRAIGISNFSTVNLELLMAAPTTTVVPAVNQVELHPYLPQQKLLELCDSLGIHVTAYSPLGSVGAKLSQDPMVQMIASENNMTETQVLLTWAIQRGTSVVPKSVTPSRIADNFKNLNRPLPTKAFNALSEYYKTHGIKRINDQNWGGVKIFHDDEAYHREVSV